MSGYGQAKGIILSVGRIGEPHFPQQGSRESTRCSQSVDAQGIITSIIGRPLAVGDETRWKGLQIKIHHTIRTYHHGGTLLAKSFDNALQGVGTAIQIVGIELHGIAAATFIPDGIIPAATDTQIHARRLQQHHTVIPQGLHCFGRTIGGMIIHHDDIIGKVCLLLQCTFHGIDNGTHTVAHRNDDTCFYRISFCIVRQIINFFGSQPSPDAAQVFGAGAFVFQLHFAICRIDIIELLLAAFTQVGLNFSIQQFVEMEDATLTAEKESECIRRSVTITSCHFGGYKLLQTLCAHQPKTAKVKIIAHASFHVIDFRRRLLHASLHAIVVGIHHLRTAVIGTLQQTLHATIAGSKVRVTQKESGVIRGGTLSYNSQQLGMAKRICTKHVAFLMQRNINFIIGYQMYRCHTLVGNQRRKRFTHHSTILPCQKDIYFSVLHIKVFLRPINKKGGGTAKFLHLTSKLTFSLLLSTNTLLITLRAADTIPLQR